MIAGRRTRWQYLQAIMPMMLLKKPRQQRSKRVALAKKRWDWSVPIGLGTNAFGQVFAHTRSEARAETKKALLAWPGLTAADKAALGIHKKKRLPSSVFLSQGYYSV